MKKTKVRKIIWGVFLIGAAGLVIANAMYDLMSFLPLICVILLLPLIIESIVCRNFVLVFIPIACLGIIFAEPLGIESITPWPILAAAALLTIGFSIIFHQKGIGKWLGNSVTSWEDIESIVDEELSCSVKFGSTTKYFVSDDMEKAYLNCEFGHLMAYFDEAKLSVNGGTLFLNARFGGVELFIPKHWRIENKLATRFGGVNESGRNNAASDAPLLTIKGNTEFAGVEIKFV
ncbi:MAG: hypothetical protein LBC96_03000 [Lachnospiraceae bacterium]|nr:hypothetical protein [Lachnospiraceae bacterium]